MRFAGLAMIVVSLFGVPASACAPPPPGYVEPPPLTQERKAKEIFDYATDIVDGKVIGSNPNVEARFRITKVYKGNLRVGQIIRPRPSHGFDAPPCAGMLGVTPIMPGMKGVIAFRNQPEMAGVSEERLRIMLDAGWISERPGRR